MKQGIRSGTAQRHPLKLSSSKRRAFWVFLLLFPFLLLIAAELILRAFQYGGDLDLVVRTSIEGKEYYSLNRGVGKRYFTQKGIAIPEPYDDPFEVKKQPGTKRIFMLGESTMAGYPYDYNATAPRLLQDRLKQLLPQYRVEVINTGLAAVNSYTVRDFVSELVDYEPDAFVVYLGHNEFYGALGIGSTESLGRWRGLVHFYMSLREMRLFLLLRDGLISLRSIFQSKEAGRGGSTLMESMVRNKTIPLYGPDYQAAREIFEANYRDIIQIAREANVPIIISTLASNVRDQEPFVSVSSLSLTDAQESERQRLLDAARGDLSAGSHESALGSLEKAIAIDSTFAETHYLLAGVYDSLGMYDDARRHYESARDLDGLRFRASSDFNSLIRQLSREEHVPLADIEQTFASASPHGLLGANLMLEHLHPSFDGYFLMAKQFLLALRSAEAPFKASEWNMSDDLTDEKYKEISGVTQFEMEAANFRIFHLTRSWPFKPAEGGAKEFPANSKAAEFAVRYVRKQLPWSKARMDLGDWYVSQEMYQEAVQEFLGLSKVVFYSYLPLMKMGDAYREMEQPEKAREAYIRALRTQESPFVYVRLGMLDFTEGRIGESIAAFEKSAALEVSGKEKMDTRSLSTLYYFLGAARGKNGDLEGAKANLRRSIEIDPSNTEARGMLERIP